MERRVREWDLDEKRETINVLETLVVLQALLEIVPRSRGRRLLGWCDNMTAVVAINFGRCKQDRVLRLVRRMHILCAEYDVQLWMCHIAGEINVVPDQLSRGVLGARVNNWSLIKVVQERWNKLAGGAFDWDAYASPAGVDSRGRRFRSEVRGGYDFEPKGQTVWAFPPVELVDSFHEEVNGWGAKLVVALIPATRVRTGWTVERVYEAGARIFRRPVGEGHVQCKGTGFEWAVVSRRA